MVAESCRHGNCKHGWYSKYNRKEQRLATLWMIGFPIGSAFLFSYVRGNTSALPGTESEKKKKVAHELRESPLKDTEIEYQYSEEDEIKVGKILNDMAPSDRHTWFLNWLKKFKNRIQAHSTN